MIPFVLLPVKPLAAGKSRLSGILSDRERAAFNRRLFGHVLSVAAAAVGAHRVLVVSRDPAVLDLATARHAFAVRERDDAGLNAALGQAATEAHGAYAVLVLPADLPLLEAADIEAMISAAASARSAVVIAPDRHDSGTNALLLAPPDAIPFAFGPGSFQAHLAAARRAGIEAVIVRREALAFDIDTAADHARLRERTAG
jgi:2-phospho-L-lactate/phosphoenolpyruvate guanylyltransferase